MNTRPTRRILCSTLITSMIAAAGGCSGRKVGQVELYNIGTDSGRLYAIGQSSEDGGFSSSPKPEVRLRKDVEGTWDDYIMYRDDVIAVQVQSAYLNRVPSTITGSRDIILFAEVWENAAQGYNSQAINTIVYAAQSQMIPSRLNFTGNLAFGPAAFSGHPFKIKFTLMILQKRTGEQASSSIGVIQNFMSAASAASPYAAIASQAISVLREVLRNQPDVVAFDFEATLPSISPRELHQTSLEVAQEAATNVTANALLTTDSPNLANAKALDDAIEKIKPAVEGDIRKSLIESQLAMRKSMDSSARKIATAIQTNVPKVTISPEPIGGDREAVKKAGMDADRLVSIDSVPNATGEPIEMKLFEIPKIEIHVINSISDEAKRQSLKNAVADSSLELLSSYKLAAESTKNAAGSVLAKVARSGRTLSDGDRLMPWLKYGYYAVVETDSRSPEVPDLQLGWENNHRLRGGIIVGNKDQNLFSSLQANYLIFSITPGQLAESPEILAAAAESNKRLLDQLRQPLTTTQSLNKIQESTLSLQRVVLRTRIERACREVAIGISPSDSNPEQTLKSQLNELTGTNGPFNSRFYAGQKDEKAIKDYVDEIVAEQQVYWLRRIQETRIK
jgi:hypothetical protein